MSKINETRVLFLSSDNNETHLILSYEICYPSVHLDYKNSSEGFKEPESSILNLESSTAYLVGSSTAYLSGAPPAYLE